MTRHLRAAAPSVPLVTLMMLIPSLLSAQRRQVDRSPSELLSAFEREYQTPKGPTSGVGRDIAQVITYPETYPPNDLTVFVNGLEHLALNGTSSSRARASAVMTLSLLGSRRKSHPVRGITDRLERIYQQTKDPTVRGMVVVGMSDVVERAKALRLLERIALQHPEKSDFPGAASRALGSLVAMDDEGRAVLRRLHETGAVRDPGAKLELANLAKQDFRLR
jgi:hypothetical protein